MLEPAPRHQIANRIADQSKIFYVEIELLAVRKTTRFLFVNGNLSTRLDRSKSMRNAGYYQYLSEIYRELGAVKTHPIFYMESHMRRWPKDPYFPWWVWINKVLVYPHKWPEELVCQIYRWKHDLGENLAMDRVYNVYNAWRIESETRRMLELL